MTVHSSRAALVSWEPPLSFNHNGLIRFYHIFLEEANSGRSVRNFTTSGKVFVRTLNFLQPGTKYQLKMAAETIEIGPRSGYENFTTMDDGIAQYRVF